MSGWNVQWAPVQTSSVQLLLSLGFANEIGFWDPYNTSEDLHCTLKAMAVSGQGQNVLVRVWSLILNDSVASFKDRWTQAKRHMWGIEEFSLASFLGDQIHSWIVLSLHADSLFMQSVTWIRVILREVFLYRYILSGCKHVKKAGWQCWCMLLTPLYLVVEQVSLTIFFTLATWAMLWKAFLGYTSIVYVVAPKALQESSMFSGKRKMIKKAA
ncbi:glycosyl transferase family group 2 protein [Nitzschia inconspicua]|uniref:Glycosyl transferase family group 2 protein n=1 Tax=Nitzschia inconspicua TaxID=303405 RepID=A0A9K3L2H4_9STRA|nr:glycosyl transferase family group 2 protein [Nitzschia inconspicua]